MSGNFELINIEGSNICILDNRPDESFFTRLDSSLKKNTAFVKKLVSYLFALNLNLVWQ